MLLTRSSMEYYLLFTERFFKPKVTNRQNRTDLKYHGKPFRGHLAHSQSFIHSLPSVTNVKIKRFVLIHISQIISQTNRSLDQWNLYGLFSNMHGLFSNMYMDIFLWAAACIHCKFKVSQFLSSLINDLLTQFRQLAFQFSFFQFVIENWKLNRINTCFFIWQETLKIKLPKYLLFIFRF